MFNDSDVELLTDEETQELARLINKMGKHQQRTGRIPLNVFMALWEHTVMPGVDLAVIRRGSVPRLLLAKRPAGDPFAKRWHIPGTRVLMGDDALSSISKRVMARDFGVVLPREPEFLAARDILKGPAGPNSSPVGQEVYRSFEYVLDGDDPEIPTSDTMKFFALDQIPVNLLPYQWPTIAHLRARHGV